MVEVTYWDVDIDTTRIALERCMRALITTGSAMMDSLTLGTNGRLGRGVSALLRVRIPAGRENAFREICQPFSMRAPPRVAV